MKIFKVASLLSLIGYQFTLNGNIDEYLHKEQSIMSTRKVCPVTQEKYTSVAMKQQYN